MATGILLALCHILLVCLGGATAILVANNWKL